MNRYFRFDRVAVKDLKVQVQTGRYVGIIETTTPLDLFESMSAARDHIRFCARQENIARAHGNAPGEPAKFFVRNGTVKATV